MLSWISVLYFSAVILLPMRLVTCSRLGDIYWNSSNPIFRIDNTDHIIDVNKGNIPFEYDQVNIICPVYTPGTKDEDVERYYIYNVSKEEYDSCRITSADARIIAICDKPQKLMYFTITFRSFTPQPGGLEFRPGQDYYFISTSGGEQESIRQRVGGKCATHNMKVIFKVCCDPMRSPTTSSTTTTTTMSTPSTTVSTAKTMLMTKPPTTYFFPRYRRPSTMTPYRLPPLITSKYPPLKNYDYPREDDRSKYSKKTEDRDKLPNETRAKNEELVNNRCMSTIHNSQHWLVLVLLIWTIHQSLRTR